MKKLQLEDFQIFLHGGIRRQFIQKHYQSKSKGKKYENSIHTKPLYYIY
jgi:hypothetical protein